MISFDDLDGSGETVNLTPIYNSINALSTQITDISSQLGGNNQYYYDVNYLLSNTYQYGYNITGNLSSISFTGENTDSILNFTVNSLDKLQNVEFYNFKNSTATSNFRTIDIKADEILNCSFNTINCLKLKDKTMSNNTFSYITDLEIDVGVGNTTSNFKSNSFSYINDLRIKGNYDKILNLSNKFSYVTNLHIQSASDSSFTLCTSLTRFVINSDNIHVDEVKLSDMLSNYLKPFNFSQNQLFTATTSTIRFETRDFDFHCCNIYSSSDFKFPDTQSINGNNTLSFSRVHVYDTHTEYPIYFDSINPDDAGTPIFNALTITLYYEDNYRTNPFMKVRASNCSIQNGLIDYQIVPSGPALNNVVNRWNFMDCTVGILQYKNSYHDKVNSYPSNYSVAANWNAKICNNCSIDVAYISGCVCQQGLWSNNVGGCRLNANWIGYRGIAFNTFSRSLQISRILSLSESAIMSNSINTLKLKGDSTLASNVSLLNYLASYGNTINTVVSY